MQRRWRLAAAISLGLAPVLLVPLAAAADTYYTTPNPVLPADCSQAAPCDLDELLHTGPVVDGDEVVVGPGTYDQTGGDNLFVTDAIHLHGAAGQPRPVILTEYGVWAAGISVGDAAIVADLEIRHSGGGSGSTGLSIGTEVGTALAERLVVKAQGVGCTLTAGSEIRDSVCQGLSTTAGGDGILVIGTSPAADGVAKATNVTAIGASTLGVGEFGIHVFASSGAEQILIGNNLIAIGGDGDVHVETAGSSSSLAGALLANSNFSTSTAGGPGEEIPAAPGEAGNQTAEPQLVDPFSFAAPFEADQHQLSGSPTIDSGGPGSGVSTTDLDGEPRCMGDRVDIGADELPGQPCGDGGPSAGPTATPALPLPAGPAPRCRGKRATKVAAGRRTTGTRRRDVIVGTAKRDVIRARGGNDLVCGGGGPDLIVGGPGRDLLLGQGGRDTLLGQGGRDRLIGGLGRDRLRPGPGQRRRRARS